MLYINLLQNATVELQFDWKLDFPEVLNPYLRKEDMGFDIVIGNPPYGAKLSNKKELKKIFHKTSFGNIDSYKYFIDKGIQLLKESGIFTYITSDSFIDKEYFSDLRKYIVETNKDTQIIKLGDDIFGEAKIPTAIILNKPSRKNQQILFSDVSGYSISERISSIKENTVEIDKANSTQSFSKSSEDIFDRLTFDKLIDSYNQAMGVKVYQVGKGNPKQTQNEKDNNSFVSYDKKEYPWFEFIDSGIKRYQYNPSEIKYIKYGEWLAEPRTIELFNQPKIVIREVVNQQVFAQFIEKTAIVKNTNAVITKKSNDLSLKYLLGIVNSSLFTYYILKKSPKSGNKLFPSITSKLIKNFPVPRISKSMQNRITELVEQVLSQKSNGKDTTTIEHQIDHLVFRLYELKYDEAKNIAPEFPISKSKYESILID